MSLYSKKLGLPRKRYAIIVFCVAVLISFNTGVAFSSSGGENDAVYEEAVKSTGGNAESHGESKGAKGWVKEDWYRVMNFTVLMVALFFLLRKPVASALNARIKDIQEHLNDLETKKREAEKKLAEYTDKIAKLEQEAEKIISDYIAQGEDAKARILKEAEAASVKLEEQAQRTIEQEFKNAKMKLQEDIIEKALKKAEGVLKSKITPEDQNRLVDEYLDKVVVQ